MDIAINFVLLIIASALFFIVGFFVGRFLLDRVGTTKLLEAEERAVQILQEAQREAEAQKAAKLEELNEEWKRKKREFEQEVSVKNDKFAQIQKQIKVKEDTLMRRIEQTQKREKSLEELKKRTHPKANPTDTTRCRIRTTHCGTKQPP
jgi:ribonuclease Y